MLEKYTLQYHKSNTFTLMNENKKYSAVVLFLLLVFIPSIGNAQTTFQTYRLQHHVQQWSQYTTTKGIIYTQLEADTLTRILVEHLPQLFKEVEDSMQTTFQKKLHIVVYRGEKERIQSNIGQLIEQINNGGTIKFTGNRIVLTYKGNTQQLLDDARYELTAHLLRNAIYGSELNTYLQNILKDEYPQWLIDGLTLSFSKQFSTDEDNQLKQFMFTEQTKTFEDLIAWNETIAGHGFCYYLERNFGKQSLHQLLQQFQNRKPLEKAISVTYKKPLWWLMKSCLAFYGERFEHDFSHQDTIQTRSILFNYAQIKHHIENNLVYLPEEHSILYLEASKEHYNLVFKDSNKATKKKILFHFKKEGHATPLLCISNTKPYHLALIHVQEGQLYLHEWQFKKNGDIGQPIERILKTLDGVTNICYSYNPNALFLTAHINGQQDVFEYQILKGKLEQITWDSYDEEALCMVNSPTQKGIYVITNNEQKKIKTNNYFTRKSDTLSLQFLSESLIEQLKKAGRVDESVWTMKLPYQACIQQLQTDDSGHVYILSNIHGSNNVYQVSKNDSSLIPLTNEQFGISFFTKQQEKLYNGIMLNKSIVISENEVSAKTMVYTKLQQELLFRNHYIDSLQKKSVEPKKQENTYSFFSPDSTDIKNYQNKKREEHTFFKDKLIPYQLFLTTEYITTQLDNTLLINQYQPYSMNQGQFRQPALGGMMKYSFADLFENHTLTLGFRIPSTAKGSDFYMQYNNYKGSLDYGITYLSHVEKFYFDPKPQWYKPLGYFVPPYIKQKTHYIELSATQPFSTKRALRINLAVRNDRQIYIATDTTSLHFKDTVSTWSMVKIEYQIDQTYQPIHFIRKGYRAKVFMEYQLPLKASPQGFLHLGLDVRDYQTIYKNIVWANKFTTAISGGGTSGILYTLGGQQNGLAPQTDTSATFLPSDKYSFIAQANNLRGYAQNIRYGNTYFLLNSEIRIPILNTFKNIHTSFNSLNHLQLVPFMDVGNAWKTPRLKHTSIPSWAMGYGIGIRTTLLTYFVRFDVAWQTVNQFEQKRPMLMFALGREY